MRGSIASVNLRFANVAEQYAAMAELIDPVQELRIRRLRALVKHAGGPAAFVRALRPDVDGKPLEPSYISQLLNSHRGFGEKAARKLAGRAGLPSNYFDVGPDDEADEAGVPVVGTAQLGDDGYWLELDYPTGEGEGFIRYPTKDPNTYALRVKGDSMRPRIKPGEFVVIEPNHSVAPGEEVMVKTVDGRSMVKLLGWRRAGIVELQSVNEDHRPITLDEKDIAVMHYVGAIVKPSWYYERS